MDSEYNSKSEQANRIKYLLIAAIFLIIILIFFLVPGISQTSKEINSDSIALTVHYGIEDMARYGRSMLVDIEMSDLAGDLTGVISVTLAEPGNYANINYSAWIAAAAGETTLISIPVDLNADFTKIQVAFESDVLGTRAEQSIAIQAENYGNHRVYGVLTDFPEEISYFGNYGTKIFYLNETNLPGHFLGLDMMDLIIIDQFDTARLSEEQQNALISWVNDGGTLVLGAGVVLKDYHNNGKVLKTAGLTFGLDNDFEKMRYLKEKIGSYESSRDNIIMNRTLRKKNQTDLFQEVYIGKAMLNYSMVSDLSVTPMIKQIIEIERPFAEVILKEDELTILCQEKLESGKIIYSAISFASGTNNDSKPDTMLNQTTGELYLSGFLYDNISTKNLERINSELYGYNVNYLVTNVLEISDDENISSTFRMMTILIVYLILAVPVTYIILRHFRISKYLWGVVPLLAVIFTVIVYGQGYTTRVKNPYYGCVDVRYIDNKEKQIRGELDFFVSLPHNRGYHFTLPKIEQITIGNSSIASYYELAYGSINPSIGIPIDYSYHTGSINYLSEGVEIGIGSIPAFQKSYFNASYEAAYELMAEGNISYSADRFNGTIVNHLETTIQDAVVISNHLYIEIGDIESNEEIAIDELSSLSILNGEMIYSVTDYQEEEYSQFDSEKLRNIEVSRKILHDIVQEGGSYFVGFIEEADSMNPIASLVSTEKSYDTTVLIVRIEEDSLEETVVFVPSIDNYSTTVEGNSDISNNRFMSSENVILNYQLPKTDKVTEIVLSEMYNNIPSESYSYALAHDIYFYNRNTGVYDLVFTCGYIKGTQSIKGERLPDYLSEDNQILIKYHNSGIESLCVLPLISYYKEAE